MTTTITMDRAGRLVLPKPVRDKLHLRAGARLSVKVVADRVELSQEAEAGVRIERRGKRLVIVGGAPFDAVAAIKADRDERDALLARRVRGK